MALNNSDRSEIKKIAKKEISDFFNSKTLKEHEKNIIDLIKKEISRGNLKKDINIIVTKVMTEFYKTMWTKRSFWEPTLKNTK